MDPRLSTLAPSILSTQTSSLPVDVRANWIVALSARWFIARRTRRSASLRRAPLQMGACLTKFI